VFGEDLEVLNNIGENIVSILGELPGTNNYFLEQSTCQPYLNVEIDREAVAAYGSDGTNV